MHKDEHKMLLRLSQRFDEDFWDNSARKRKIGSGETKALKRENLDV